VKLFCVFMLAVTTAAGCGESREGDAKRELYRTTFHLGPDALWDDPVPPSRHADFLDLIVEDGTCGGEGHPRQRLHRVDVKQDLDAVVISVWMRKDDLAEDVECAGVGILFVRRVKLARPIGERGIIDAGFSKGEPPEVELEPRDRAARRRLRERYHVFN
jgi:hypothetical protein